MKNLNQMSMTQLLEYKELIIVQIEECIDDYSYMLSDHLDADFNDVCDEIDARYYDLMIS